jgi:phytoene dehydrogenase-like protein
VPRHDAIVIGAGHNGLVAAAYLARAGLRTVVLERRECVGGACVTEERWPGYRVSRGAYVVGLLRPAVVRELDLAAHGLRLLRREPSSFTPLPDGRGLLLGADAEACAREIGRFSARDAARYRDYERLLDRTARTFEPLLDAPPPDPARLAWRDVPVLARVAARAVGLRRDAAAVARLLLAPARATLEAWFESEPLRATLATDALIGAFAGPGSPGTGYVLFHHVMGETGGARGVWAYVEGGMGALAGALAAAARAAGAEVRVAAPVASIDVAGGRVHGVTLGDGTTLEAPVVVSGADPQRTLLGLVGVEHLPEAVAREAAALDVRSPVVKINLALARLPRFRGRSGAGEAPGPEHAGTIHVGATDLDALERSYAEAAAGRLPDRPMVELTIPSALDRTLAPAGRHVASLFVQHVPPAPDPATWPAAREAFADRALALVDEVAPGFSASVLHREVLGPPELEAVFGLSGGNLFHGAMTLDRLLFLRPFPGWSRYQTPVSGLWLCGAGTHPGGGIMGACGRNAALELLRHVEKGAGLARRRSLPAREKSTNEPGPFLDG